MIAMGRLGPTKNGPYPDQIVDRGRRPSSEVSVSPPAFLTIGMGAPLQEVLDDVHMILLERTSARRLGTHTSWSLIQQALNHIQITSLNGQVYWCTSTFLGRVIDIDASS